MNMTGKDAGVYFLYFGVAYFFGYAYFVMGNGL